MLDIDFNYKEVADKARRALETWGYECECNVENRGVIAIKVYSRNGVELDGKYRLFRFCATEALTRSSSGRHRYNYYYWEEGLAKFSSANFWLRRGGDVRGACSDSELAYIHKYDASHSAERAARMAAYNVYHRAEISNKKAAYYVSHRDERLAYKSARDSQLWTNGIEILPWTTLHNRGRKPDLIMQGWHPL